MSSRNGLTAAIREQLRTHGEQTATEVHEAMVSAGLVEPQAKNVSAILSQRLAAGEFQRRFHDGRVRYSINPDHQQSEKGEGARLAVELAAAPPATSAFGTTCRVDPQQRAKARRRDQFLEAIGDDEATVEDLVSRLVGWSRQDVLAELRELADEGRIRTGNDPKLGRLYWIVDPEAEPQAATEAPAPLPPVRQEPREATASGERRTAQPGNVLDTRALRERVAAFVLDIESALDDALDERLPNDLLRELLLASLGANRALRLLDR